LHEVELSTRRPRKYAGVPEAVGLIPLRRLFVCASSTKNDKEICFKQLASINVENSSEMFVSFLFGLMITGVWKKKC
jgi:hypothetical protein